MAADSVIETSVDRGTLDIWPAHSGSHQNKLSNVSKPLFLKQMEDHLQKELAILGCPKAGPHISRLQAHKEVFEHLIENFKTYKPILSAIKNEYDLFIKYQDGCIRELLPLKTQINLMEDEFEKRVLSIKERNKKYDEGIHEQCRTLQQQITELKSKEQSYEAQLKRLQEELAIVYEKYRNEADGRKLLISDYNELKARLSKGHEEEEICDKEDPTILKLKLARATEDLRASNGRINQILADYGDVVPRRDFEMMETSYRGVESELETLKVKYTSLQDEHNVLTGMYKDMAEHRDKVLNELTRMKGTATPRPDWSRCAEFIEGGEEVWAELSEGKSSDHLVDVLLAQIAGVDVSELMRQEVFTGQGVSSDIPCYLRAEGTVINRKINRKELEELITGFWEYRMIKISQGAEHADAIDEMMFEYLLSRSNNKEQQAIEDGYNLQDACSRFHHEFHISLFISILSGEMDEEVYDNWISTQVALVEELKKNSIQDNLNIQQFEDVIKAVCPGKPIHLVKSLVENAVSTCGSESINIIKLMDKGDKGEPNPFVMSLLEQSREETKQYVKELTQILGKQQEVSYKQVADAIMEHDPNKPLDKIHLLLSKIFSVPLDRNNDNVTISYDRLVNSLTFTHVSFN